MNDRYHFEALGDRIKLCVSPEHKFGTDAFLLSDFAAPRRKDRACDLGTGCGIVALAWYRTEETRPRQSYGVDIQPQAIDQLTITVRENDLEGQVVPVLADLTDRSALPEGQSFDVVTCNPPYRSPGTRPPAPSTMSAGRRPGCCGSAGGAASASAPSACPM